MKIPTDIHVSTRDWYVQYTLSLANSHCRQRSTTKSHWILLITFVKSRHPHCSTMNWFGKKKPAASTVSSGSSKAPSNPQGTIVTLRENIATQEKRWATSNFLIIHPYSRIQFTFNESTIRADVLMQWGRLNVVPQSATGVWRNEKAHSMDFQRLSTIFLTQNAYFYSIQTRSH